MAAHIKYGHRNFRSLAKSLNMRLPSKIPFCQACVEAKATRHPKSKSPHPPRALAARSGYRVHFDPFGPFNERLSDGTYYGLLFVDAYSRVLWFDTIPSLKEWFPRLCSLVTRIETEQGSTRVVAELACDSAPMFKDNREFRAYADSKGIVLLFSPPYTQKLNSVVERPIRTLCEMALAMSRHANAPKKFMNFAMKLATRLLNRTCMFRRMPDGTVDVPLWRYKGAKVPLHLDSFHPYGCAVEAVLPQRQQTRFGPKTISCIFLGYDDNALSYILAKVPGLGLLHTAHAVFNDDVFPCRKEASVWTLDASFDADTADPLSHWLGKDRRGQEPFPVNDQIQERGEDHVPDFEPNLGGALPTAATDVGPVGRLRPTPVQKISVPSVVPSVSSSVRRSARGWQPSAAALQSIANSSARTVEDTDDVIAGWDCEEADAIFVPDSVFAVKNARVPRSYKQICGMPQGERDKWFAACRAESASHLDIPSIGGVLEPHQWTTAAPIRLSWVFAIKPTGEFKARIVMLGQHMQEGIHFNDTFAPVPAATVVRLLFALAASEGWDFTQLDVKTAFLTAPMDIELDVILPEGFGRGGDHELFNSLSTRRRRALTAIPGCPQGTRVWREKLVADLSSLGFNTFIPTEPCMFRDVQKGEQPILLLVWVDDILVFSPSDS